MNNKTEASTALSRVSLSETPSLLGGAAAIDLCGYGADRLPGTPELLTRKQAAAYLGISVHTLAIWKCTKRYRLPFVRIGSLIKYKRSELDAFIAKNQSEQA